MKRLISTNILELSKHIKRSVSSSSLLHHITSTKNQLKVNNRLVLYNHFGSTRYNFKEEEPESQQQSIPKGVVDEDILYQQNSTDLLIRLKTTIQCFFNLNKVSTQVQELYNISGESAFLLWLSLNTNYLLTKYNFDVYDFHIGAKEAIKQLQLSIASKDFYNYINKYSNDQTINDFMKLTLHPILFKGCVDAVKHLHEQNQMIIMKDIEILSANVSSINTYIVTSVENEEIVMINGIEMPKKINYPFGSVIINCDVTFVTNSKYEYHLDNGIKEETKLSKSTWTFQSCLSNHIPMNWMVTKFDGLGHD